MADNLYDLYKSISNPLRSIVDIRKIVEVYSNSRDFNFYKKLLYQEKVRGKKKTLQRNTNDYNVFLFNTWKNDVLSISNDKFKELKEQKYFGSDFFILQDYLSSIPDAVSSDDVFLYTHPSDYQIGILIRRYGFFEQQKLGFNEIYSENIEPSYPNHFPDEHFLALNTNFSDTLEFCRDFQIKCMERDLPYHYKYDTRSTIIDNVLIYTDTEHILDYIEIIEDVYKDNPNLLERSLEPSILTGKINGIIGYGSCGDNFYVSRANHLNKSITDFILNYIKKNPNHIVKGKENYLPLFRYISSLIALSYIDSINLKFTDSSECFCFYDISLEDINSVYFYNKLEREVEIQIKKWLKDKNNFEFSDIDFCYNNDFYSSNHVITKEFILSVIRENSVFIFNDNFSLYYKLRRYLIETASLYDFSNKYCFDIDGLERFKEEYLKNRKLYVKKES